MLRAQNRFQRFITVFCLKINFFSRFKRESSARFKRALLGAAVESTVGKMHSPADPKHQPAVLVKHSRAHSRSNRRRISFFMAVFNNQICCYTAASHYFICPDIRHGGVNIFLSVYFNQNNRQISRNTVAPKLLSSEAAPFSVPCSACAQARI